MADTEASQLRIFATASNQGGEIRASSALELSPL
jgi:hypothetical protein